MAKKKWHSNVEINQALSDAWLNLKIPTTKIFNPLDSIPVCVEENPEIYYAWLMTQPDYFSFICKEILNIQLFPTQALILKELWNRKFPMFIASRGFSKTFSLGLYTLLRILLMPGRKIAICGAGFRQSKMVFEYIENIWNNAPLLRDIVGSNARNGPKRDPDALKFTINDGYCVALPIGNGEKIRGYRANDIIADEFAAHNEEIFETVIAGFGAVSASPIENIKHEYAKEKAKELGIDLIEQDDSMTKTNQIILSGTAFYSFNHFGRYHKKWHTIISSRGDKKKLKEVFGGEIPDNFDWKDYSIIRIPYNLAPKGFMDDGILARAKASNHADIFNMEYGAIFISDSNGFFKRSLIEKCTLRHETLNYMNEAASEFNALLKGNPNKRYVYGVDPASEVDRFSIVILELNNEHRKIVYVWTTNKKEHQERVKFGLSKEHDFYSFCARKIRDLMKVFPCERIALDSQGGGYSILETLHDKDKLEPNELPIWEIIDEKKEKQTDNMQGSHIVELINFASADWTMEANHGMKKDFEDRVLLFPNFDAVLLATAGAIDMTKDRVYDTLEDCMMEIEELKNELCLIEHTQTDSGRERWDTPNVKLTANKKGRMRKDRYSGLLMANASGRKLTRVLEQPIYTPQGGFVGHGGNKKLDGPVCVGPDWYNKQNKDIYKYL